MILLNKMSWSKKSILQFTILTLKIDINGSTKVTFQKNTYGTWFLFFISYRKTVVVGTPRGSSVIVYKKVLASLRAIRLWTKQYYESNTIIVLFSNFFCSFQKRLFLESVENTLKFTVKKTTPQKKKNFGFKTGVGMGPL
jgi:hypothetical protein